jgi:hypothetical protein
MFQNLRITDPYGEKRVRIGKMSYVWAGLFGPLFVLVKAGPLRALFSLGLSIACAVGLLAFVANLHLVPQAMQPVALVFVIPGVFLFHSLQTVALVTSYYRQMHWVIRLY